MTSTTDNRAIRAQEYLDSLGELQSTIAREALAARVLMLLLAVLILAVGIFYLQSTNIVLKFIVYFFCGLCFLSALVPMQKKLPRRGNPQLDRFKDQLKHSGLADRLLNGEITGNELIEHTQSFFRWLIPKVPDDQKAAQLRRVASNLEWYLGPPRTYSLLSSPLAVFNLFALPPVAMVVFLSFVIPGMLSPAIIGGLAVFLLLEAGMSYLFGRIMLSTNLLLIENYLVSKWQDHDPGEPISDPIETGEIDEPAEPPGHRRQMLLVVNQLDQDLAKSVISASTGMLLPLMFVVLANVVTGGLYFIGIVVIVTLISTAGPVAAMHGSYKAYRLVIRSRLERSGLAGLIAMGGLQVDEMESRVPWIFHAFAKTPKIPKGYADELRRVVWRVAYNLDWFLSPPAVYIRASWIAALALLLVGVITFIWKLLLPAIIPTGYPQETNLWLVALAVALSVPINVQIIRTAVWAGELVKYLRERLAE